MSARSTIGSGNPYRTNSVASSESRWVCPSAKRNSIVIVRPYATSDGVLYVEDQRGPVASQWLQPDDNPAAVARRLLREKCSPNSFFAPIVYPHRVVH
jgi:hypothetical protein